MCCDMPRLVVLRVQGFLGSQILKHGMVSLKTQGVMRVTPKINLTKTTQQDIMFMHMACFSERNGWSTSSGLTANHSA